MRAIRQRAAAALRDPVLQRTLPMATRRATEKQQEAWQGLFAADAYRDRAAAIKTHTLDHLDRYLLEFEEEATKNGIRVHWAATHEEARSIIVRLLEEHDVQRVVKAKSMTTEELELTERLTERGIDTWETDLGEYIVQLSGRPPSHITAPAIHEDTASISQLFRTHLGTPDSDDPEVLAGYARSALRSSFLDADCGISGANFLVAQSGRIVLVENEGNIRLATSLPRLHIAVAGIEKVIPREEDLPVFLKLLARSATGQNLTTYTHSVRGPREADEQEGPDAVHVILLDAGRSAMLADRHARAALGCIRCGSCLNVCPVYRAVGGHTYGSVYPGPIGAITAPWLTPSRDSKRLPYASTLCGACEEACPVRIPIPEILLHLRAKHVAEDRSPGAAMGSFFVKGYKRTVASPERFQRAGSIARNLLRPFAKDGRIQRLLPPLSGWTRHRTFRSPAKRSFHARWAARKTAEGAPDAEVEEDRGR